MSTELTPKDSMAVRARRWLGLVVALVLPLVSVTGTTTSAVAAEIPTITGVSPGSGKTAGGTSVHLRGTNLSGVIVVRFGTKTGTKMQVVSDTEVSVVSPSGSGTVAVTVTSPAGTSAVSDAARFRYVAAPSVSRVAPGKGASGGGTRVTVTGRNFVDVRSVLFGTTPGTNVQIVSESSVTVTAPKHSAGRVDVRVVTAYGKSGKTSRDRFTFIAAPKITKVSPATGPMVGGKKVTVYGARFTKLSQVRFGETPGTGLRVVSSHRLTVKTPPGEAGTVAVTAVGLYGTSRASSKAKFRYVAPPAITGLAPARGSVKGGTRVTVSGTDFAKVSKVLFGTKKAGKLKVKNTTRLSVVTPAQSTRTVDVRVVTAYGTSPVNSRARYTYGTPPPPAAPTITSIKPATGPTAGGTRVAITGTNLTGTSKVTVGGGGATGLTVGSATSVTITTPAHPAGTVDIALTAPGGSVTKTGAFTYVGAALAITTSSLPAARVGAAYSKALSAAGGTSPYSWTATGLPDGLGLSSAGVLSGTPTTAGTYTPRFTVTDHTGTTASQSISLQVDEAEVLEAAQVDAGGDSTCAVTTAGTVHCWGANGYGQLGDGTTIYSHVPVQVVGVSEATAISLGVWHTCALTTAGTVYCWGANGYGQLGDGTVTDSHVPVQVVGLTGATAIIAGEEHTCALTTADTVKCWGKNSIGQLGDGTTTNSSVPVQVIGLTGAATVAADWFHTCAVTTGGTVFCWGANGLGQLGDGNVAWNSAAPVQFVGQSAVTAITAGEESTCAVTTEGTIQCWGDNHNGQLGDGTTTSSCSWNDVTGYECILPVQVVGLTGATAVTAGWYYKCALTTLPTAGTVNCWGLNDNGQLGDGTTTERHVPVQVSGLTGATGVTTGALHTCALTTAGVSCWGNNQSGQLGDRTTASYRTTPVSVIGFG